MTIRAGQVTIFEDTGFIAMDRVIDDDGEPTQQADVTTITYGVWDTSTGTASVAAGTSITVSDAIFDSLQKDARWQQADDLGYNFRFTLPASAFPSGGRMYRAEFKLTPASGQVRKLVWDVRVLEVRTS